MELNSPTLIKGDSVYDQRGSLSFINDLDLIKIRRFYIIENNQKNFIRAWHAHKYEQKIFICIKGGAQVSAVKINDFDSPSKNEKPFNFVLNEKKMQCVYIPNGYANGSMTLIENTKLLIFSDSLLEESVKDDYRFPYNYWDNWSIEFK
tara:strand:+ start:306 stop:752 length:447 start_codon:yes stop_codon:yes gene_type:complete